MENQSYAKAMLGIGCAGLLMTCVVAVALGPNSASSLEQRLNATPQPAPGAMAALSAAQPAVAPSAPSANTISMATAAPAAKPTDTVADAGRADACQSALNKVLEAQPIKFGEESAKITKQTGETLDKLGEVARACTSMSLEIGGYTDSSGRRSRNLRLSQDRAAAVKEYLVKQGLSADRLTAVGFGPDKPVASNRTASGRARNRRIEIKVVR